MQSKDILEGRDYAYCRYPKRSDIYSQRATRVRVLKKGQARNKRDRWGYDLGVPGQRKDGVEIRYYTTDAQGNENLTDRTAVVTARNLLSDWPDFAAKTEALRQRAEAERRRAEQVRQERLAKREKLQQDLARLGIEACPYAFSEWRISTENVEKLLALIPAQANVPDEIDYAEVAGVEAA